MTHLLRRAVLALALIAGITPAIAQTFPTVPAQSVIGRLGQPGDTGPSQAILFGTLRTQLRVPTIPAIYAADKGVKCDGITDDSPAMQQAVNAADSAGGVQVIMPNGVCRFNSTVFLNKSAGGGILAAPGLNIVGQGKGVTTIDTRVANGFAIAVNPDWKAAHKSLFGISATTGGSGALATNTYYVQITVNDPSGNEVIVTAAKPIAVTGPTGRIAINLGPLNSGYSYNIYCGTTTSPGNYCIIGGGNASAIGGNQSVNIDAIGSVHAIPGGRYAIWQQAVVSDLAITSTVSTSGASGISYFKAGYANVTNAFLTSLNGTGFELTNYTGDVDGSFMVRIANSKFDHIAGNCVDAGGNTLEMSNFTVDDRTIFNICGTLPTNYVQPQNYTNNSDPGVFTISSITNSTTPVVTTSAPHTLQTNDQVYIRGITGMTLADGWYRAAVLSGTTYNLKNLNGTLIDTTSLGSYTASSGRSMLAWRPPTTTNGVTGCMVWMGLIGTFRNIDFTQCNNFSMYFTENGTSDNATLENIDFENTYGKALYIAALSGGSLVNAECLTATAFGPTISCVQMGTGFNAGGVLNFQTRNMKVRSNVAPMTAFEQFQNTNLPTSFSDTNRVSGITWQAFDAAGQTRFNGVSFDPIPGQVKFSVSATNTFKLAPTGFGCTVPLHLQATGEWVPFCVPDAGITLVVSTSSPNTTYNIFVANGAATAAPYVLAFAASTTGTTFNNGYSVKSTDSTQTLVGSATTDGSGNFQPGNAQTSQYPPAASVSVGSPINGGSTNGVMYDNSGGNLSTTASVNNAILITGAAGIPVLSATLPAHVIASSASTAFAVGPSGSTNSAFNVDASVGSMAAGLNVRGAVTGGTVALIPTDTAPNTNIALDAKGAGSVNFATVSTGAVNIGTKLAISGCTIGANIFCATGSAAISGALTSGAQTITSASATALAVGAGGTSNSAFTVNASTASQAAGLRVTGAVTTGRVNIDVTDPAGNSSLGINALGTGTIAIGNVSTGGVSITPALTLGVPLANSNLQNPATTVNGVTCTLGSTCQASLAPITNSLVADVLLNNISNYFDGPSVAQGTTGTWLATGTVTMVNTAGVSAFLCKLWDGTTVIGSGRITSTGAGNPTMVSLSGMLASPAANIRISCRDTSATTSKFLFNDSGNSKDSTLTAVRVQ